MNIQITGRHLDVTEALKQYAEEKVQSLTKYSQKIFKVHILLYIQNNIHQKCEINLEAKNLRLSSHAETKNMYESISKAVDKLSNQMRSHKYSWGDKNHRTPTKEFEHEIIESENLSMEETA